MRTGVTTESSAAFVPSVMLFTVLAFMAGCDRDDNETPPGGASVAEERQSRGAEERVARRALERWEARIRKDWKGVYGFLSPGARATRPYEVFAAQMARTPLAYLKAKVLKVECPEKEKCVVQIEVENEYRGPQAAFQGMVSTSTVQEEWLKLGDQWWFAR